MTYVMGAPGSCSSLSRWKANLQTCSAPRGETDSGRGSRGLTTALAGHAGAGLKGEGYLGVR